MALIKCPECGKEISDKSSACIHCGYPLVNIQQEKPSVTQTQPVENSVSSEHDTTIELGFTLFSVNESCVNLECKNCSKVYKFNKTIFSETSKDECVPSDTIRCPNCGNTTHKNSKIQPKQSVQNASEAKESVPTNDKANDNSGTGCLGWLIGVGVIVVIGMFLLTDGFSDFALWWLVFPLTFAALLIVGMIYSFATSDPKEVKQNWDKEKYNDYKFTCPMCGSKKVKKIGTMNRAASVATVGLASSKIGKQYECDDCKHKW